MPDGLDWSSPNECAYHYKWSVVNPIVTLDDKGNCPLAHDHVLFGPAAG